MPRKLLIAFVIISLMGFVARETGREKQFIFKDYFITSYTFNYADKEGRPFKIMQFMLDGRDSVLIYHGQELIVSFHMKDGLISDSSLQEYDSGRMTHSYTFSKRKGWFGIGAQRKILYERYAGMITSEKAYWPNGKLKLERYIGKSSGDSVRRTWYSSGALQRVETQTHRGEYDGNGRLVKEVFYYRRGGDSLINEWYPSGAISRVWSRARETKFYENGAVREAHAGSTEAFFDSAGLIMHEANRDTFVEGHSLMYTREYTKGILRHEKFFCGYAKDQPCHVWKEYDEHGKLLKTINKTSLELIPVFEVAVEGPGLAEDAFNEEVFVQASQSPEYIGGAQALNVYLESSFKAMDKKTLKKFKGSYKLNVRIHKDGKVAFVSIEGENSDRLTAVMPGIVEQMKWNPAKIDGRLTESEMAIMFEAK